jgi:hypothetical protein
MGAMQTSWPIAVPAKALCADGRRMSAPGADLRISNNQTETRHFCAESDSLVLARKVQR